MSEVQHELRDDSERLAVVLNSHERALYHLCALIAERDTSTPGIPDSYAMGKARAYLEGIGITDMALLEIWQRGETGRTQ